MHDKQFYFCLFVGLAVTALGILLSKLGPAGWSLAVVGSSILGLSMISKWQSKSLIKVSSSSSSRSNNAAYQP